jgi:taurine dioxygenase
MRAETFARIEAALHKHCMIAFPGQSLDPKAYVAFARLWGPPEPHVIDTFHHPADPNILILSNVKRGGKPIGLADAGTYFHTDYSYLEVPARVTMVQRHRRCRCGAGTTSRTDAPRTTISRGDAAAHRRTRRAAPLRQPR